MKWKWKLPLWMTIIFLVGSFAANINIYANSSSQIKLDNPSYQSLLNLHSSVAKLYELANSNHKSASFKQLRAIKKQLQNDKLVSIGTKEGWIYLINELQEAEHQLLYGNVNRGWKESINRVYLAVDAMVQPEQGPWLQYEKLLLDRTKQLKQALKQSDEKRFYTLKATLQVMNEQMNRMKIAVYMAGDATRMEELEYRITDLQGYMLMIEQLPWQQSYMKEIEKAIAGIELATVAIFAHAEAVLTVPEVTYSPSALTITLLLAAFVSSCLAYAGFRKYRQTPYGIKRL